MENVVSLDVFFKRIYQKIEPRWWAAFGGCVVIGLLTYMYMMTNNFLTYDSMWNIYSDQDMITSGRQFLTYACGISSFYNLPWLNGVLAIVYLGFAAVVVTEGLEIKSKVGAILTGGLLVTFPAVSSTFCYIYTVDGYMLAVLLAALAFLLASRKKWGWIGGIVLLGVSMGIYQAYLSFTIILCILSLLIDLLKKDSLKEIFTKIWHYIAMGIGSYLFYVLTLNLMLKWKGMEISGYQGTDRIGSFAFGDLPEGLKAAWTNFIDFARWSNVLTTSESMKWAFVFIAVSAVVLYIILFIKNKSYKSIVKILLALCLAAAIPWGATIVNILSPQTYFHLLMRLPWALFFIFAIALCEEIFFEESKRVRIFKKVFAGIICTSAVILIFNFSIMANIVAFNMNERYEKTYATCLRLVDRMEQTEGYTTGTKVAILGGYPDAKSYPNTEITQADLVGYFGSNGALCVSDTEKYAEFFRHYLNVTITTIPLTEEIDITQSEEFMQMPKFPAAGSIQFIGDVLVIKLNG